MWAIIRKDLTIELRTGEMLSSLLLLALLAVLVFAFALDPAQLAGAEFVAGLLWTTLIFAATLALNRSFLLEREAGGWTGLALAPVDRGSIYLAKAIANLIFLTIAASLLLPVTAILIGTEQLRPTLALPITVLLGVAGISAVGTLFAAIAIRTRAREVLLPLLIFPLLAPVVIAAAKATAGSLEGRSFVELRSWLLVLVSFDVIFFTAGWTTFDFIIEE